MRRLVLALQTSAVCVVTGSVAFGADLPRKAPPYYNPAPVATWAGFYAGVNAGWGWAKADATILGVAGSSNLNGAILGGQVGYNWQSAAMVFGAEADLQASDQRKNDTIAGVAVTERIPYFGTLRGRLGYAANNWLFYVTGGAAYGRYRIDATFGGVTASVSDSRWALTIGGGVEWMFGQRWSAKLEYLYIDTGNYNSSLFGVPYTARARDNIVRVGVNYHF